jgi:tripartite ATP-independent transporter DctP family solute receptor
MKLLKSLAAAVLLLGIGGIEAAQAQQAKILNLGLVGRLTAPEGVGVVKFAELVKERTNGRIEIRLHPVSALGGEREMLEGVQIGTVDIALAATAVVGNFVPEVQILDIPFLFRDFDHAQAVLDGPIGKEMLAKFPARGIIGLALGGNGFRQLTNSRRPVGTPDDLKGMKLRTMENQTHLLVWRALGALPTPMALPEVFTALQQGTVDGQENPIGAIINNKFGQVQKHLTITNHAFTSIAVVMAPAAYNALSEDDKTLMVEGARLSMKVSKEQVAVVEKTGIGELRGMGLSVVDSVDTGKFQELLRPTYAELAKKFGEAAIARIRDYK